MPTKKKSPEDIDAYIASFPEAVQDILIKVRATIREMAPEAKETISYGMPAFIQEGPLIYYAAYPKHISIYPAPRDAVQFKEELTEYAGGKGTVQFPLDKPIPYDLIRKIAAFRSQENLAKAQKKARKNS